MISRLRGKSVTPEPESSQPLLPRNSLNQYHRPNLSHPPTSHHHRTQSLNSDSHSPAPTPHRRVPAYDNVPHQTVITLDASSRNYSNGHRGHNQYTNNGHSRSQSQSQSRRSPPPSSLAHAPTPPAAGRLQQVLSWK